jgi:hypothetical protein
MGQQLIFKHDLELDSSHIEQCSHSKNHIIWTVSAYSDRDDTVMMFRFQVFRDVELCSAYLQFFVCFPFSCLINSTPTLQAR